MPTWVPSSPTLGPLPVLGWTGGALQINGVAVSQASTFTTTQPVLGDNVLLRVVRFGTLTGDCTLAIEFAIDDAASNFGEAQVLSNAQINNANGLSMRIPSCGKFYRFRLNPGTMVGANGLVISSRS